MSHNIMLEMAPLGGRRLPSGYWVMGISGEREEHKDGKLMVYMETREQPLGHAQGS